MSLLIRVQSYSILALVPSQSKKMKGIYCDVCCFWFHTKLYIILWHNKRIRCTAISALEALFLYLDRFDSWFLRTHGPLCMRTLPHTPAPASTCMHNTKELRYSEDNFGEVWFTAMYSPSWNRVNSVRKVANAIIATITKLNLSLKTKQYMRNGWSLCMFKMECNLHHTIKKYATSFSVLLKL